MGLPAGEGATRPAHALPGRAHMLPAAIRALPHPLLPPLLPGPCAPGEPSIVVVRSPRSGANFWDLGAFDEAMATARSRWGEGEGPVGLEAASQAAAAKPTTHARQLTRAALALDRVRPTGRAPR